MYLYEGIIGIPAMMIDEKTFVNYLVEYDEAYTDKGECIFYITKVMLMIDEEVVALYHHKWVKRPEKAAAHIALYLLALEAGELDNLYDKNPEAEEVPTETTANPDDTEPSTGKVKVKAKVQNETDGRCK